MPSFVAQPFFNPVSARLRYLPEGPRLLQNHPGAANQWLGWVAIQHGPDLATGSLCLLHLDTLQNEEHPLPGRPGFFAETEQPGLLLIGLERRLVLYNVVTRHLEELGITVSDHPRVIINDGQPVPGGVYFGTKHLDFNEPVAELFFFDALRGELVRVLPGQTCSNGKIFWPHAASPTLFDIDSSPKTINRYQLDATGRHVHAQKAVVAPSALPAYPDGMRQATQDSALLAFFNPALVSDGLAWQISLTTGECLAEWHLPGSPRVTCPEFIPRHGRVQVLFTTADEGMSPEGRALAPGAGMLYLADTPFTTLPPAPPLLPVPPR